MKVDPKKIWIAAVLIATLIACGDEARAAEPKSIFGGGWIGGGGELLEHGLNPWFIERDAGFHPFSFCVSSAPDFAVARPLLKSLVLKTISWWTREFSNSIPTDNQLTIEGAPRAIRFAVQTRGVYSEECDDSIDLRFQFGNLSDSQRTEFNTLGIDISRYVAQTIRTNYSDALRGKGFIYISPDRGPNAFRSESAIAQAWTADVLSDGQPNLTRLEYVLRHELGHVFGMRHGGPEGYILNAQLPELGRRFQLTGTRFI